jgi:hypothetical protein
MRPHIPIVFSLVADFDDGRHRGENRRHECHRALASAQVAQLSWRARLGAAFANLGRDDHSVTDYACRLPNGNMGRLWVVQRGGGLTAVCREG